jgi:hypothetical protein
MRSLDNKIELSFVKALLEYNPNNGEFHWKVTRNNSVKKGSVAGWINPEGYRCIQLNNKEYKAHRLGWFLFYGEWPINEIDHINGRKLDNRIENLRDVSKKLNMWNQHKPSRNNKSGFIGVYKHGTRYRAQIGVNGMNIRLGFFKTPEEAHEEYLNAKRYFHSEVFD